MYLNKISIDWEGEAHRYSGYCTTVAAAEPAAYTVTLKEGTEDADNWTITPEEAKTTGVAAGTEITATYSGTKRVKSVKAVKKGGAAPAGPVTYTELKGGEVLHVGDIIEVPVGQEWSINDAYYLSLDYNPFTVVRANITGNLPMMPTAIEAADGAYYVIKDNNGLYYFIHGDLRLPVTETSDGIYVTYNGIQGSYPSYTFSVHEPTAPAGNSVDLSTLTGNYEAQNGDILTGATDYAITIAAGATVTLDGVNISSSDYCIKCLGDATIILKDGSTNTLTSWSQNYPALWAGDAGTTLTIQGSTGALTVESGDYCAGIGGGYSNTNNTCGNIRIEGGVITAQGGNSAAGIGSDSSPATCGDIIITGGTVTATGGYSAAGIGSGSGSNALCGDITITDGVTSVTATKGNNANYSIGAGPGGTCGTITIGGTKYWENNAAVGDGATYLATSPLEYQPN